ncbi:MAG: enoyl-CoA hydratase [bacterium]|nr:enoyl-CoA hydratase [bacterium]
MAYQEIRYEVEDPIATITLDRPKQLNAWTNQMGAEVKHAFARAESDPSVVVIILTGAGRGFCAGADLGGLETLSEGRGQQGVEGDLDADPGDPTADASFRGTYSYPMSIGKPVIAAINGPCAGMAVPIACFCDMRFAAESARFTTAFSRRGLIAEWGISWILTRLVGPAHACDLLFSARKVDASEAERIGLVNRVLPDDELQGFVKDYAKDMAANCSPRSIRVMKREIYQHMTETLEHANKEAALLMFESFEAPDFKEGVRSFLEKRPPQFERLA